MTDDEELCLVHSSAHDPLNLLLGLCRVAHLPTKPIESTHACGHEWIRHQLFTLTFSFEGITNALDEVVVVLVELFDLSLSPLNALLRLQIPAIGEDRQDVLAPLLIELVNNSVANIDVVEELKAVKRPVDDLYETLARVAPEEMLDGVDPGEPVGRPGP
jgi:hypothetical protein